MAINKNFVIKNGVQVGTDLIVGDSDVKKVGIGTTIAGYTLHVAATNAGGRGGIGATDAVITGVGTIKDLLVTGFSGFSSDISVTGIVSARSFGIGTTEIIDRGMRLSGIASLDAITINTIEQAIRVGPNSFTDLKVTGISTFIGIATFSTGIDIKSGVSTFSAPLRLGFAHTTDHAGVALGATVGFGTSAFFRDDAAIFMGSDSDLKIHHDGSNSRIQDVGTGDLIIQGSADIKLQSASAENYIVANDTGSVDVFFDNSKKLETTSGGLKVTGITTLTDRLHVEAGISTFDADVRFGIGATVGFGTSAFFRDDAAIFMGNDSDLKIHHDGSNSRIQDVGTGDLILQGSADIKLQSASAENYIVANDTGSVEQYFDNSKKTETTSGGFKVTGITTLTNRLHVQAGVSTFDADVRFGIGATVGFGTSAFFKDNAAIYLGDDSDLRIYSDGSTSFLKSNDLRLQSLTGESYITNTANGAVVLFYDDGNVLQTTPQGINVSGVTTSNRLLISGISTFTGLIDANGGAHIDNLRLGIDADNDITTSSGNLTLDSANGNVIINDNLQVDGQTDLNGDINLGDATSETITVTARFDSHLLPSTDGARNLGSADLEWADLHIDGTANIDDLDVDGTSNFADDVVFAGASANITFDQSTDDLIFDDNAKAIFGSSSDGLEIFHDGSNSKIKDSGTGTLDILTSGVNIKNVADNENIAKFTPDGAVQLYYDNSKKVETTSGGLNVTGITTISDRLQVTSGISTFYDTTQSTSATTGAVVLDGGLGVAKNVNIGGNLTVTGTTTLNGGTVTLGDANTDNVVFSADVDSSITPDDDDTYDLGSATKEWRDLHLDGIAHLDNVEAGIGTFSSNLLVSGISTFSGNVNVNSGSDVTLTASIGAGSSTILFDSSAGSLIFQDNIRAKFGTGSDLSIYHDSGNSFIDDTGTGDLNISGSIVRLQASNRHTYARGVEGGAFELYHNNVLAVETTADGIKVGTGVTIQKHGGVSIAGITTTTDNVNIAADNKKLLVGASQDLEIFHDGNHSFISNTGTGGLILSDASSGFIYLRSNDIRIQNAAGSENSIICTENGAVSLHFDSAETLTTTADGVEVGSGVTIQKNGGVSISGLTTANGGVQVTGGNITLGDSGGSSDDRLVFGASSDLSIYHDASHSRIVDSGTGHLIIQTSELDLMNAAGNEDMLKATADGSVELYHNNVKAVETTADGILVGTGVTIQKNGGVSIAGLTTANGGIQITGGNITLGDSSDGSSDDAILLGAGTDLAIYSDGSTSFIKADDLRFRSKTGSENYINCTLNGAVVLYHDTLARVTTTTDGVDFGGTGSIRVPNGTTGQRNASPQAGDFRYNTTDGKFEGYTDSWGEIGGSGGVDETDTAVSTTSATTCGSFAKASFRSAAIIAQITQGSAYQVGRYLLIHDGTTVTLVEETAIATGSMLGTFSGTISGDNVLFQVTMGSSDSATVTTKIDTVTV